LLYSATLTETAKSRRLRHAVLMGTQRVKIHKVIVRVKPSLSFNLATCHEGLLGDWRYEGVSKSFRTGHLKPELPLGAVLSLFCESV
jgi:hypothetical protein